MADIETDTRLIGIVFSGASGMQRSNAGRSLYLQEPTTVKR